MGKFLNKSALLINVCALDIRNCVSWVLGKAEREEGSKLLQPVRKNWVSQEASGGSF